MRTRTRKKTAPAWVMRPRQLKGSASRELSRSSSGFPKTAFPRHCLPSRTYIN